jgi:succinate dehydrogenase / fumarate reductase membrane anchor subunit
MVNRIVVGAHYGLRDWLAQRITAVVMALYTVILAVALLVMSPVSYDSWRALFSNGLMRVATFVFFVCLFYHVWIGIRDIFMDYIKPTGVRLVLHVIVILLMVGYTGWAAQTLWRL